MEDLLNLPLDERQVAVKKLMDKNADKVPVIFRCSSECTFANKITVHRMFLPKANRIIDIAKSLRRQFNLTAEVSMCFSSNDVILQSTMTVQDIYEKYKSEDHILYLKIHELSPFGC